MKLTSLVPEIACGQSGSVAQSEAMPHCARGKGLTSSVVAHRHCLVVTYAAMTLQTGISLVSLVLLDGDFEPRFYFDNTV